MECDESLAAQTPLRIAGFAQDSIVDGEGIRYTVFFQGCPHGCPGCHNPQTHDPAGGEIVTVAKLWRQIQDNPLLDGVTLSGGEPFCQPHPAAMLAALCKSAGLSVWAYTGYTLEELLRMTDAHVLWLLRQVDVLVDGRFAREARTLELPFRGSSNQRLLDLPGCLKTGRAVEYRLYGAV